MPAVVPEGCSGESPGLCSRWMLQQLGVRLHCSSVGPGVKILQYHSDGRYFNRPVFFGLL